MVEQEYSKGSAVFSGSLSCKSSQNNSSIHWCINDTALIKSEDLCSSDLHNAELLYGSVLSTDGTFYSPLSSENLDEKKMMFQETVPNDIFSSNDYSHYDDLYYDKSMSQDWNPVSEKNSLVSDCYNEPFSPLSFWSSCPLDCETLKMDEIFQVDKDDLVQSPTLAELNANDESLFDSFDNFGIPLPTEHKSVKCSLLASSVSADSLYKISLSEASQGKTKSDTSSDRTNILLHVESSGKDTFPENENVFGLKENKKESYTSDSIEKLVARADTGTQVVTRHEKKFVLGNESSTEASKQEKADNASESPLSLSNHMLDSEDDESEMDCDYSSDVDEESEEESKVHSSRRSAAKNLSLQKKKSRYFWQYNIQSKGPKGPKMKLHGKSTVTDNCSGISDPVFTSNYLNKGIKHAGKARRGDGNDLTPNPQKLYNIGLELEKLTSVIEGLTPANELPINARSDSRKEKNKLASRACRLKKKAQHEANKLKLFGLQKEQKRLQNVINDVKKIIKKSAENVKQGKVQSNVHAKIEALCIKKCYTAVAGCSAEFVNNVLKNVGLGDKTGGLDIEIEEEE